ncbi:D-cysteine desulfhydrase [bacterium BMS3Abin04]|nr:D-cysteine desulfhydrase [bacterium BMS3Abin04]
MKIPKKLLLANLPTPIQQKVFRGKPFFIKRDDFTGLEMSGNKVRKLEYLMYDAKNQGVNYVFTCGGEQSNHSRATAIAAASIGVKSKLFLWGKEKVNADGNLFIDRFVNSEIRYLTKSEYSDVNEIMLNEKKQFTKRRKKVYIIPEGGTSPLGIWGYIEFMKELKTQVSGQEITGITVAAGSGGTAAGLLVGAELYNLNLKVFAVNVLYSAKIIRKKIEEVAQACVEKYKLDINLNFNQLEILDGYSKEGYKHIASEKIKVIRSFTEESGIILDPAYTGKAFYAFQENFLNRKKKTKVLFLHTGGIFGAFAKRKNYLR